MILCCWQIDKTQKSSQVCHSNIPLQQQPFHVELACSNFKCFLPESEAKASEIDHVKCSGCNQNYEVEIWNQDKTKDDCPLNCPGLSPDALGQKP